MADKIKCPACGEMKMIAGLYQCIACDGNGKDSDFYRRWSTNDVLEKSGVLETYARQPLSEKRVPVGPQSVETVSSGGKCPTCGYTPPEKSTERVKAWRKRNAD